MALLDGPGLHVRTLVPGRCCQQNITFIGHGFRAGFLVAESHDVDLLAPSPNRGLEGGGEALVGLEDVEDVEDTHGAVEDTRTGPLRTLMAP